MAFVQNADTISELRKAVKIDLSENTPQELGKAIIPVVEVNPKLLRHTGIIKTYELDISAASVTIFVTPSNQDFYITHAYIDSWQNATYDGAADGKAKLNVTFEDGTTGGIISVQTPNTTACKDCVHVDFARPIKVLRGSTITGTQPTFTAGKANRRYCVMGYLVDGDK